MPVAATDRTPLYARLEAELAHRVASGALRAGAQLPSEQALIGEFGVSRTTVRSAVAALVQRGLLEIRRGRGTFVAEPRILQEMTRLTGFVEDMESAGREASALVLDHRLLPAPEGVAARLALPSDSLVVRIRRVRLADGVPLSYDETFLPRDPGERIAGDDLCTQPIFTLLERKYRIPLVEAELRLEATLADAEVADALKVAPGHPVFVIERTSLTEGGRPVDHERLHYRGDRIRFRTRLLRDPPGEPHSGEPHPGEPHSGTPHSGDPVGCEGAR